MMANPGGPHPTLWALAEGFKRALAEGRLGVKELMALSGASLALRQQLNQERIWKEVFFERVAPAFQARTPQQVDEIRQAWRAHDDNPSRIWVYLSFALLVYTERHADDTGFWAHWILSSANERQAVHLWIRAHWLAGETPVTARLSQVRVRQHHKDVAPDVGRALAPAWLLKDLDLVEDYNVVGAARATFGPPPPPPPFGGGRAGPPEAQAALLRLLQEGWRVQFGESPEVTVSGEVLRGAFGLHEAREMGVLAEISDEAAAWGYAWQ